MSGKIYLLQNNSEFVEMTDEQYESENLLQELLSEHPDLLAGNQMNSIAPRRWLLVKREMGIPDAQDGSGRWSLDHLFLDQDGVPTLVEVKRSKNPQIRREIIGQMLDYAANAVAYLPLATLKACFTDERREQELVRFLNSDEDTELRIDPQDFWQQVESNLQNGRLRLVFVADKIPMELQRIVEFLNDQMARVEVLAVEVRQYVGQHAEQNVKAFVPRVIGQTAQTEAKKERVRGARSSTPWNATRFFEDMEARNKPDAAQVAQKLYKWATNQDVKPKWGTGSKEGFYASLLPHKGIGYKLFGLYSTGNIEFDYESLAKNSSFALEVKREELRAKLNEIISDPKNKSKSITGVFWIDLNEFKQPTDWTALLTILEWLVTEIKLT